MSHTVLTQAATSIAGVTRSVFVDADEVVPDGIERNHVHVVLELLGERSSRAAGGLKRRICIRACQSSKPTDVLTA